MKVKQSLKQLASFDYVGKTVLVSSAAYASVSIALFSIVIGAPVGIIITSLGLVFYISNRNYNK